MASGDQHLHTGAPPLSDDGPGPRPDAHPASAGLAPWVAGAIVVLVAARIALVALVPLELGPDEAQYWRWAQVLDWGYYSKPPLIAWAIHASTAVFGDAPWAVRLLAPLAHGLAGWFLFLLGRRMFDDRIGAWAAAVYLLMPGVWLSSVVMSTDALLLPAWAASLLALWSLRQKPGLVAGLLFGLALGVAVLAKYAALYLLAGAALASILDAPTRRALLSLGGLAALAGLVVVIAPNLIWNAQNDFATVSHTADNTDWETASLNFNHLPQFLADQAAVFGPMTFLLLLAGLGLVLRRGSTEAAGRETWLLCFVLPPLVMIAIQAVISRAHANWAATAYPAASVLLAAWIVRPRWGLLTGAGVGLNALVGAAFAILSLYPAVADRLGVGNAFTRVSGWTQSAAALNQIAKAENASVIMFDEREAWHGVDHAGRDMDLPPLRTWRRYDTPHSYAEEAGIMQPGEDQRVLVASVAGFEERIKADFSLIEPRGEIAIPLPGGRVRTFRLFLGSGYEPLPRTAAYEAYYSKK